MLQFFRLYCISTCLSSSLDATVGPKCNWRGNNAAIASEWDKCVCNSSSSASTTSGHTAGSDSSYVSDETLTNESHSTTASTTKCSSLINTPSPPDMTSLKRPFPFAVDHLVTSALALKNNGSVNSSLNDRSLDILRRRTHEKEGNHKLKTLEATCANDSSGFQSRSSISITVSNSSLESIALNNDTCPMTDDETEDLRKFPKSFKSRHLAF